MKITNIRLHGKYRRNAWRYGAHIIINEDSIVVGDTGARYRVSPEDLLADDWQEYQPIDFGTEENPKLILIKDSDGSLSWVEGFEIDDFHIRCLAYNYPLEAVGIPKSYALKAIDLPSKEF